MCVDKTWNLKYNRTEMTAATNEYYIGWFFFYYNEKYYKTSDLTWNKIKFYRFNTVQNKILRPLPSTRRMQGQ